MICTRPTRRRLGAVLLAAAVGLSTALLASPAEAAPRTRGYVALGDSYAAGEGLAPYETGTNTTTNRCHRSVRQSYPELLERSRRAAFRHLDSVACSGAITTSLFQTVPQLANEPAQLDALKPSTRTVTLSIGGNDARFAPVLVDCIYTPLPNPDVQALIPGRPGCAARNDAVVSARIANLSSSTLDPTFSPTVPIPLIIAAIHQRSPRAQILVTSVPPLFGSPTTPAACSVGNVAGIPLEVTADDAAWIRAKGTDLAQAVATSVAKAQTSGLPAQFVDIGRAFGGHNVCDTKTPWINGVLVSLTPALQVSPASFHPTPRGQVAYARAVSREADRSRFRPAS